jgi:hypothetical protein
MRPLRHTVAALALLVGAGGALAGCGSGKGSTAAHREGAAKEATPATSPASSTASTSTSSRPGLATITKTATATSTRTSSAPAFAQPESRGQALAAAVATVERQGYRPDDVSEYHPGHTLRVLTATRTDPSGGHEQRAFFFVDERFIGTDASEPSASLKVLSQGETRLTLGYGLYRSGDSLCCPSGEASVRFQLNDGRLQALDPIPPVHSTGGPARL